MTRPLPFTATIEEVREDPDRGLHPRRHRCLSCSSAAFRAALIPTIADPGEVLIGTFHRPEGDRLLGQYGIPARGGRSPSASWLMTPSSSSRTSNALWKNILELSPGEGDLEAAR